MRSYLGHHLTVSSTGSWGDRNGIASIRQRAPQRAASLVDALPVNAHQSSAISCHSAHGHMILAAADPRGRGDDQPLIEAA